MRLYKVERVVLGYQLIEVEDDGDGDEAIYEAARSPESPRWIESSVAYSAEPVE